MIYAIHAVGTNFVKFGKAKRTKNRLANHQIGCPLELRLLVEADWPDLAEGEIHRLLWKSRERGEWFRLDKTTVNVIALMKEPDGYSKLSSVYGDSGLLTNDRLSKLYRLTKEDIGVWRTRDHEAAHA